MRIIFLKLFLTILCLNYGVESQKQQLTLEDLLNQTFGDKENEKEKKPEPQPTPTNQGTANDPTNGGEPSYTSCGENKVCVPFYNCKEDTGLLNTDGEGILDIRFDDSKPCASYLETCCTIDDKANVPSVNTPKPMPDDFKTCGKRNENGIKFKITGQKDGETEYGEFPWMIAVLLQEFDGINIKNIYKCGGSLIHPQVVMTAAHCVHKSKPNDIIVRAGEWDTQTQNELFREQDRQVVDMILHEKFSKSGLHHDIALLFIREPFNLGIDVSTLCLPPSNLNFDHSRCFATGWGTDKFGVHGKYQVIMKKIELPVVPRNTCENTLRTTRLGKSFKLNESFMCAGGEVGKDTCKGDGGSPLSCPIAGHNGRYYQAGIVGWGVDCGTTVPGIYGSVPYFRDWIDNAMKSMSFGSEYYTV